MPKFEYLRSAAARYGALFLDADLRAFLSRSTPEQLDELASAYREIARREDAVAISRWIDYCLNNRSEVGFREHKFGSSLAQLLALFGYLGEQNVPPFNSAEVGYVEQKRPPHWGTLPAELHYLITPAEKYGGSLSEADILRFLETMTPADIDLLSKTAERIRQSGDLPAIYGWLDRYPLHEHPEAALIYGLLGCLDLGGFGL
jgi:hypothetical protein